MRTFKSDRIVASFTGAKFIHHHSARIVAEIFTLIFNRSDTIGNQGQRPGYIKLPPVVAYCRLSVADTHVKVAHGDLPAVIAPLRHAISPLRSQPGEMFTCQVVGSI